MKASMLLAAIAGMFGVAQAQVKAEAVPMGYQNPRFGRSRVPGPRGQAGDKLARMAGEARLTLRKGW
jgi:hypothetical protein